MNRLAPRSASQLRLAVGTRASCGWGVVLLAVTCLGCASGAPVDYRQALEQALRSRGLDPAEVIVPYELNDEMTTWARDNIPRTLGPSDRLMRLRDLLLDPKQLKLEYAWGYTGTAAEVFNDRRANCLAFTNLFVGMARELDIEVYFLAVERVETYRKQGDLVVVSDHVAVGYGDAHSDSMVFDFSELRNDGYRSVKPISDMTAIAMFHSNRGAESLQAGYVDNAVRWLRSAVLIDPELVPAWVNLGVVLRRAGDFSGAEDAYKHALEIDPRMVSAYQNLAALLQRQGRTEEARGFLRAMQKTPSRNPYSYLTLGDISLSNGHLEEARRFYRRANNLVDGDAEVYAALGQLAVAAGDLRTARKMLRRAQKIDGQNRRTLRLETMVKGGNS